MKLARVAANREQFQTDLENLEAAKRLAEEIDHQPRLCQTLYWLGRTHYVLGQHGRVAEYVEPALQIAEALQDDRLTAAPLNLLGRLKFFAEPKVAAELLARSSAQIRCGTNTR